MAITITQKPTTPNAAYTRLVYVVSGSTNTSSPQFSYVMDVKLGSTLVSRITQTVNPAGVAVFDPSRIVQGELSEDQSWKISSLQAFNSSSKIFTFEFGEQYGTSDSSSITVYPNSTSDSLEVFRGVVEPNDGSYNWQSSSYAVLSNMPATMSMQSNDYGTISVYNNNVSYISQSFYSASSAGDRLVDSFVYSVSDEFATIPISTSAAYWNYANVEVNSAVGLQKYRYEVSDETHREKVRFAFINKLGTWDYYNNYNPVRQTVEVNREQYTANRVDYSSLTSAYNIERRGLTDYHNTQDDSFTTQTDYLTKEDANWLEELLESPSVYIQRNNEFIPIVILNASYTANTSQARQKLFQYTIEFIPSNQPFGTWNPEFVECPQFDITVPLVLTNAPTSITFNSFTMNGEITNIGGAPVTERGFVYSTSSVDPDITDTKVTAGSGVGTFSSTVSPASSSAVYYYKAYGSSSVGVGYGSVATATTSDFIPLAVTAYSASDVTCFGFRMSGSIDQSGSVATTERGFVYGTSTNPTIADTKVVVGSGLGEFSYHVSSSVVQDTTYYYRAYGSSSYQTVQYSNEQQLLTDVSAPTFVTQSSPYGITTSSFSLTGSATQVDTPIVEKGFVYSTTSNPPTISDTKVVVGSGDGPFSSSISGVSPETTFYVRAYASSSCDLAYSNQENVDTLALPPTITTSGISGSSYRDAYVINLSGYLNVSTASITITERGFAYSSQSSLPDITSSNSITSSVAGGPTGNYQFIYSGANADTLYYGRAYTTYDYYGTDSVSYGNVISASTPPFTGSLRSLDPYAGGTIASSSLLYWYDFTDPAYLEFTASTDYSDYRKIQKINNKGTVASASLGRITSEASATLEQGYAQFISSSNGAINQYAWRYGDLGRFGDYPGFKTGSLTTTIFFHYVDIDSLGYYPNNTFQTLIQFDGMIPDYIDEIQHLFASNLNVGNNRSDYAWYSHNVPLGVGGVPLAYGVGEQTIGHQIKKTDGGFSAEDVLAYTYSGSDPSYPPFDGNGWQSNYIINHFTYPNNNTITAGRAISGSELSASLSTTTANRTAGNIFNHEGLQIGNRADFKLAHFLVYTGSLSNTQIQDVINDFSASVTYGNELNAKSN